MEYTQKGAPENQTGLMEAEEHEYIFDKTYIQVLFICLYSVVFCFCFFGNLAVILVVTLHWRLRGITKFCLGNLAFANLCVAIFCVYQNLSTYLMDRWVLGVFMCKMYHFVNSMSHTASVLILVVTCAERYLAILHPLKCRRIVTFNKLRIIIVTVWILSAILCSPRLYYITTYRIPSPVDPGGNRSSVEICAPQRNLYDTHTADMVYFILLFVFPLSVISILYTRMGIHLWRSPGSPIYQNSSGPESLNSIESNPDARLTKSRFAKTNRIPSGPTAQETVHQSRIDENNETLLASQLEPAPESIGHETLKSSQELLQNNPMPAHCDTSSTRRGSLFNCYRSSENAVFYPECHCSEKDKPVAKSATKLPDNNSALNPGRNSESIQKVIKPRRSVVRMLIIFVITFAFCNLPFHLRKICQNYVADYDFGSNFSNLLTPLTFLLMYANCAINPILYAFMSKDFRAGLKDLLNCRLQKTLERSDCAGFV